MQCCVTEDNGDSGLVQGPLTRRYLLGEFVKHPVACLTLASFLATNTGDVARRYIKVAAVGQKRPSGEPMPLHRLLHRFRVNSRYKDQWCWDSV